MGTANVLGLIAGEGRLPFLVAAGAKQAGLETVPILRDDYILGDDDVGGLVAMSNEKSVLNPQLPREGIVIRPIEEAQDPELGRLSFKVVNPEFLLKYEE